MQPKPQPQPLELETKLKLLNIYKDPENRGSFGGVNRLYEAARAANLIVNKRQVREWLSSVPTYTRYRSQRVHFERRRVLAFTLDWCWEVNTTVSYILSTINGYA